MEVSNDLVMTAINNNSAEVARLGEKIEAMLTTHAEFRSAYGNRIKSLEHRQMIMAIAGVAACLTMVLNTGKGANILAAVLNMF